MINYEGRLFRLEGRAEGDAPLARYHQDDDLVWADFAGGDVRRGSLAGRCEADGTIEFAYSMVLVEGGIVSGRSRNTPSVLEDGRIRFHEEWERYGPHAATGISYLLEVR